MVGEESGLQWACAARDPQGEKRNDGVARARNVKYLLGNGRDVVGRPITLAKQHAEFAKSDQQNGRPKTLEQTASDQQQVGVLVGVTVPGVIRQSGQFKCFLSIRSNQGKSTEIQNMRGLRVEAEPFTFLAAEGFQRMKKRLRNDPFAIVA